jgi:hypothetical protein
LISTFPAYDATSPLGFKREIGWDVPAVLSANPPQRRLQPLLFLFPIGFLGLHLFLDRVDFGAQCVSPLRVLRLRFVQGRLRLVDGLLLVFALLLPGRLLLGPLALATLALPFVRLSRLPVRRLVRLGKRLLRLGWWLVSGLRPSILAEVLRQFGVFAEVTVGSHGTLEVAAHKAVDDVKRALGERGPVWWKDGSPDLRKNRAFASRRILKCLKATWKDVALRLLDDTCQVRTGRHEEDGCWPSFE